MTSPMKNSRSQLDLDKTLIKAKPVTSQNRVLGAPRALAPLQRVSAGLFAAPHLSSVAALRRVLRKCALTRRVVQCAVTGGGGFLGSHLVDYLIARGDHVRAALRAAPPLRRRSSPAVTLPAFRLTGATPRPRARRR